MAVVRPWTLPGVGHVEGERLRLLVERMDAEELWSFDVVEWEAGLRAGPVTIRWERRDGLIEVESFGVARLHRSASAALVDFGQRLGLM